MQEHTHFPLLVPGAKVKGTPQVVKAPFDGKTIATVDCADKQAIGQALATAHECYLSRKNWLTPAQRIAILEKVAYAMGEQRAYLAANAAHEGGKPLKDSVIETDRAIDGIKLCIEVLRSDAGHVIPMRTSPASAHRIAFTQKEPIGVVVAISAFNHPLNLIVHQVATAVAAGCPVIVKPATATPLSCLRLVQLFHEAGLPPQWCQALVIPDNELATQLVIDERVDFFSFIGSAKVGWQLRSKLAAGTRCSLEHGGIAPVIVAEDADIEAAMPLLIRGGFYHAGQVCVSVQRIFVHRSIARVFAKDLAELAMRLHVGDPTLPETDVGPLINFGEVDRVQAWVDEAVQAGAKLLCGGERLSSSCYAPTVLLDPPHEVKVSQQEVFGPVVCVYAFDEMDDAIAIANSVPYAFQAAVFTQSIDTALYCYRHLAASAVMVNDHTAFRVDGMPFAGLQHSGLGVGGIPYTLRDLQIEKMMVIHSKQI